MTLPEYIIRYMETPFKWGEHDCMTFTIGWVENVTGEKYLPEKLWTNEFEALRTIKKQGGLEKVFDKNFERIEPNCAKDGDLTIADGVASLFSGRFILSVGEKGIAPKSRNNALVAWEVKQCLL